MDDLVAFLEARLAEDEQTALSATREHWSVDPWRNDNNVEFLVIADHGQGPPAIALKNEADAAHIARHDPARILREVQAKRLIFDLWKAADRCRRDLPGGVTDGRDPDERDRDDAVAAELDDVVRLLALPYVDHPDFNPDWGVDHG